MRSRAAERNRFLLITEKLMDWTAKPIVGVERIKYVLFSTLVCAVLANLYCWTNSLFSHDSLLIVQHEVAHNASIGRPFQEIYIWFRGAIVAPFLVGSLGTVFLCVGNAIIVALLSLRSRGFVVSACALLTVNATITLVNATYISWFDIMMLSYALSCLAAWLICERPRGFLLAAPIVCLAMGLYQSYFQVCALLCVAVCARKIAVGERRQALVVPGKGFVSLAVGAALYFLCAYLARELVGVEGSSGYNSVFAAFSFANVSILQMLAHTWLDPFAYMSFPETHAIRLVGFVNLIILVMGIASFIKITASSNLSLSQKTAFLISLFLMPFAAGCINFAASGNVHAMMILSYFIFYPIIFSFIELCCEKTIGKSLGRIGIYAQITKKKRYQGATLLVGAFAVIITLSNIVYANQVYLKKDLEYQATLSTVTRLEERLEEIEDYQPGETPVVLIGVFAENPILNNVREDFPPDPEQRPFESNGGFTKYGVGLGAEVSLYGSSYIEKYFKYIIGCPIRLEEGLDGNLSYAEAIPETDCFPLDGSVRKVDDVVVVRLS